MANLNTNVITGEVRLSYVHLLEPYAMEQGQKEKYSTTILIPKHDTATKAAIDAAIEAAAQKGINGSWNGVRPKNVPNPLHDGDGVRESGEPYGDECKGHWVLTASSIQKPDVVNKSMYPLSSSDEVYSGMYARVFLNFYPYAASGRKGVAAGLGPVQKIQDGEVLGGAPAKASDVFSAVEIDPITGKPIL